jgi:hypothetical protein
MRPVAEEEKEEEITIGEATPVEGIAEASEATAKSAMAEEAAELLML